MYGKEIVPFWIEEAAAYSEISEKRLGVRISEMIMILN